MLFFLRVCCVFLVSSRFSRPDCHLLLTFFMIRSDHLKQAHFNSIPYLYTNGTPCFLALPRVRVFYVYCAIVILHLRTRLSFVSGPDGLEVTVCCRDGNLLVNRSAKCEAKTARIRKKKVISTPKVSTPGHINIITLFFLILFDSLQHSNEI